MSATFTLEETAQMILGHVRIEDALFKLTGVWSTDGSSSDAPSSDVPSSQGGSTSWGSGLAVRAQGLFSAESAHHGWRAEQWERRRVRSVDADSPYQAAMAGSDRLVAVAGSALAEDSDPQQRLAVWGLVLAPALAARYDEHCGSLAVAADEGLRRWLKICVADLQSGATGAVALLQTRSDSSMAEQTAASVASAVAQLLGPS